ncbi:MAG: hypothetical protein ACE5E0_04020 [Terriglobia bacterium]
MVRSRKKRRSIATRSRDKQSVELRRSEKLDNVGDSRDSHFATVVKSIVSSDPHVPDARELFMKEHVAGDKVRELLLDAPTD